MTAGAFAQVNGDGYYRVYNLGRKVLDKKNFYVFVDNNKTRISNAAGTGQNFEAVALWRDTKRSPISDPASIVYAKVNGNNVDLEAQGTSVSDIASTKLYIKQNGTANSYTLSATKSGVTLYLWSSQNFIENHYIATTIEVKNNVAYKFWGIDPVSSASDNYFGVKPTLNANGKYYAPFFASFPFKFASAGMKAYYVKNFNNAHFALEEITTEVKPGGTPMIIECSSENPSDNRLDLVYGDYPKVTGNQLWGTYFCNDFFEPSSPEGQGARVTFDPSVMRTWNVENGQLVLSTATDNLHTSINYGYFDDELEHGYINQNESYLKFAAGAKINSTLTLVSTAVEGVASSEEAVTPVSYTTLDGMKIEQPKAGMGVVVVKYSDGTAKKVVY